MSKGAYDHLSIYRVCTVFTMYPEFLTYKEAKKFAFENLGVCNLTDEKEIIIEKYVRNKCMIDLYVKVPKKYWNTNKLVVEQFGTI